MCYFLILFNGMLLSVTRVLFSHPQSVFNGMHVIFIPYSLMKVDPASWMKMVTKYKGNVAVCF